jgi:hypothetical protein
MFYSLPQVIKFTSYLPMVGGSLWVLRLLPPLKLVAMILLKVALNTKNQPTLLRLVAEPVKHIYDCQISNCYFDTCNDYKTSQYSIFMCQSQKTIFFFCSISILALFKHFRFLHSIEIFFCLALEYK